jgi:hypothetical protein
VILRINNNVINAILLSTDKGYFYSTTVKLEYPYKDYGVHFAYTHSEAKDLLSPGSTASGSWNGVRSINGNNDQQLSLFNNTPHRMVGILGTKFSMVVN